MADERNGCSPPGTDPAGGRDDADSTGAPGLGSGADRADGQLRPRRFRRADLIVWLVLFIVAVATVVAAFTIPLAGQKDDVKASPKASSTASSSTADHQATLPAAQVAGSAGPRPVPRPHTGAAPTAAVERGEAIQARGVGV